MYDLLDAIGSSAIGDFMAVDPSAFPAVETVHVIAITTVIGLIAIVDLRLIGLAGVSYPISRLSRALLPPTWIAFILAGITGTLLFTSQPVTYFDNMAFRIKLALMLLAGINMLVFHYLTMRNIAAWDRGGPIPAAAKLAGLLSLSIWILVVACGRWIGFTTAPF
ncbi:DUF6644 family protein [Sphingobium nicotianae]|uniref:DUF6644 domain-containing protein n=1 Tax=Sphingobium nicotianae TaxID=2782607 RepID=A0A9X1DAE0_9SPHN|nr:DUF6644 family protein [Sphingobium nicotianae]MBT2186138.1 hypothetical protein [Sphingobium nicotianae]